MTLTNDSNDVTFGDIARSHPKLVEIALRVPTDRAFQADMELRAVFSHQFEFAVLPGPGFREFYEVKIENILIIPAKLPVPPVSGAAPHFALHLDLYLMYLQVLDQVSDIMAGYFFGSRRVFIENFFGLVFERVKCP